MSLCLCLSVSLSLCPSVSLPLALAGPCRRAPSSRQFPPLSLRPPVSLSLCLPSKPPRAYCSGFPLACPCKGCQSIPLKPKAETLNPKSFSPLLPFVGGHSPYTSSCCVGTRPLFRFLPAFASFCKGAPIIILKPQGRNHQLSLSICLSVSLSLCLSVSLSLCLSLLPGFVGGHHPHHNLPFRSASLCERLTSSSLKCIQHSPCRRLGATKVCILIRKRKKRGGGRAW